MIFYFLLCLIGFVMLYYGAEWLVKGSSSLARSLGVTPIVIGLTVVALITVSSYAQGEAVSAGFSRVWLAAGGFIPRRREGQRQRPWINDDAISPPHR